MAEHEDDTGISTRELIKRLDAFNRELMDQSRTRHQLNNQLTISFQKSLESVADSHTKSLDTVAESNRNMAELLRQSADTAKAVVILQHWAFGVDGKNGMRSVVTAQGQMLTRHESLMSRGLGGLAVLQVVIGLALAVWTTLRG